MRTTFLGLVMVFDDRRSRVSVDHRLQRSPDSRPIHDQH